MTASGGGGALLADEVRISLRTTAQAITHLQAHAPITPCQPEARELRNLLRTWPARSASHGPNQQWFRVAEPGTQRAKDTGMTTRTKQTLDGTMDKDQDETTYRNMFDSPTDAEEYEALCLSAPRDLLPACTLAVLDDRDAAGPEYWTWLCSQVQEGRDDLASEQD